MSDIFLSYSQPDRDRARGLYDQLTRAGFDVWFDTENLQPGDVWEVEIRKAMSAATFTVALVSSQSSNSSGYQLIEIDDALKAMANMPDKRFLISIRLDDVPIPESLGHLHFHDLFDGKDAERLVGFFRKQGVQTSPVIPQKVFDRDPTLILPGYGAYRIRLGQSADRVEAMYGPSEGEDPADQRQTDTSSHEGPADPVYNYFTKGCKVYTRRGRVSSIALSGRKDEPFSPFVGCTPEGISVDPVLSDVKAVYGAGTRETTSFFLFFRLKTYSFRYENGLTVGYKDVHPDAAIRWISVWKPSKKA
jgi:hypothetical protein